MVKSKKEKVNEARKNAEALKAKKKAARGSQGNIAPTAKKGKGQSLVGQPKKGKK